LQLANTQLLRGSKRPFLLSRQQREDRAGLRLDAPGAAIAALRLGFRASRRAPQ
jgi:hypothetical protein